MTTDVDIIIDHTKLDKDHFIYALLNKGLGISMNDLDAIEEGLHGSFFLKETIPVVSPNVSAPRFDWSGYTSIVIGGLIGIGIFSFVRRR